MLMKRTRPSSRAAIAASSAPPFAGQLVEPVEAPDVVQPPFVHVIGLQPGQALLELATRPIAGHVHRLGGDPHLVAAVLGHQAYAPLGLTVRVDPGGIEVADAAIERRVQDLDRLLFGAALFVDDALRTEAEDGQQLAGLAEMGASPRRLSLPDGWSIAYRRASSKG